MEFDVAALYIDPRGPYAKWPGVWAWDEKADARKYAGPFAVVAHPPCSRWCRLAGLVQARWGHMVGDDGGCFAAALATVREWGGVLEHPEASYAFAAHGLNKPQWRAGWQEAGDGIGKVCCVAQGNYGHRARKLTWLYAVLLEYPELDWSIPPPAATLLDWGFRSKEERRKWSRSGAMSRRENGRARMSQRERAATPEPFAELLLRIARQVQYGS